MAKFLNLSKDVRFITHGVLGVRAVKPSDVVDVADEVAQAYASQPGLWQPVCEIAKAAAAAIERDLFGALEGVVEKPAPAATPPATAPTTPAPAATPPATAPATGTTATAVVSDATSGEAKQ